MGLDENDIICEIKSRYGFQPIRVIQVESRDPLLSIFEKQIPISDIKGMDSIFEERVRVVNYKTKDSAFTQCKNCYSVGNIRTHCGRVSVKPTTKKIKSKGIRMDVYSNCSQGGYGANEAACPIFLEEIE